MQLQKPVLIQEQRQKLSPQMIQSIRLMALPLPELKDEIQQEIETNPALEVLEDRSTVSLEAFPEEREADSDAARIYENASDPGYGRGRDPNDDTKRMFLEGAISQAETLQEHLLWQLRLQRAPERIRAAAENLIQNLDSEGFHKEDPRLVCRDATEETLKSALTMVRGFEPVGVCASDYRESLIIQTEQCPDAPPRAVEVLRDHIELLEKGKHEDIRKRLKLTEADLAGILTFIKTLNPFPGRQYSSSEPQYVIPDIQVKLKDEEFVIVLNEEEIPVLGINPFFDRLSAERHDRTTDAFVKDNIRKAKWFIQSIHQRNKTLLKATRAVVEFQRAFFTRGPKHLAPLTLRDVAVEVGVHETTISRLANRKYVQTDWGIFEFKYFFTNSISGAGSSGSRFSKEGVKQVIKEIIENEARALSDRDIAEQLARKGIKLARRTVAKYRLELNMDSSFGRRHE